MAAEWRPPKDLTDSTKYTWDTRFSPHPRPTFSRLKHFCHPPRPPLSRCPRTPPRSLLRCHNHLLSRHPLLCHPPSLLYQLSPPRLFSLSRTPTSFFRITCPILYIAAVPISTPYVARQLSSLFLTTLYLLHRPPLPFSLPPLPALCPPLCHRLPPLRRRSRPPLPPISFFSSHSYILISTSPFISSPMIATIPPSHFKQHERSTRVDSPSPLIKGTEGVPYFRAHLSSRSAATLTNKNLFGRRRRQRFLQPGYKTPWPRISPRT